MNNLIVKSNLPSFFNRDEFLTPFDRMFDQMIDTTFPGFFKESGVSFEKGSYPRVNVYDFEDKINITAEIPGLNKKDVQVVVEDGNLTIFGDKHSVKEEDGLKILRRELKQSSFRRSFSLGDNLNHEDVLASFKDGILSIDITKKEPEKPEKKFVKIS